MNSSRSTSQSGQVVTEFSLMALFILLPLTSAALFWYCLEWNRIKCANKTFSKARLQLIQTHSPVDLTMQCGSIKEKIKLKPLEDLDQNKGGLGIQDLIREASQLRAQL